ncbi:MAG: RimK/LysX family protein [Pirellulales bacterium]
MNTIPWVQRFVLLVLLCLNVHTTSGAPPASEKAAATEKPRIIIGRVEFVVLRDVHVKLRARIDTGAGISSVHAKILEIKQAPDGERVRFQIEDGQGGAKTLERKIVGWANIKVMGTDQKNRRPIVKLHICLGGKRLYGRVNLNDRGSFLYPMLVGRNLLNTGKFLVDPSQKDLKEPGCE